MLLKIVRQKSGKITNSASASFFHSENKNDFTILNQNSWVSIKSFEFFLFNEMFAIDPTTEATDDYVGRPKMILLFRTFVSTEYGPI